MIEKKTIWLRSYPPLDWTPAQWASAERVAERYNDLPIKPEHWHQTGEYIGREFNGCLGTTFIGIERDGYTHS